ncbi:SAM-dependent methyltransferase [Saccharothrix ecbatanensis]|uniref:SAM-dependent methyltransferase n=1 Tax=Saccharothrix ecbatanensis TaxID=1105145 RepID=A0A7W9HJG7_9PSEU|nr:class I SAM-dependent methyltransferase [Saccharothrix ecbatanensis]MBB5803255.1 SAM-dependent methyltransferase [Saccharothrix ecbatanensis]
MAQTYTTPSHDNVDLVAEGKPVDAVNAEFYSRFQYPWPPQAVRRRVDPSVERTALGQSAGDWTGDVLPERPRIWVAGCGTNQAVLTALRFPDAHVVGSDVSPESVAASAQLAERLGVTNLDLQVESINDVTYDREFDHVISTGVVHHNADPAATLARVAAALAPDGLLELMVYNRYHCTEAIAVQKAVRLLAPATGEAGADFDAAMTAARHILDARPDLVARMKPGFSGVAHFEAAAADALIQPVMHTFTVAELDAMAGGCGLELALPCVNQFDVGRQCVDWNLRFADTALQRRYLSLTDVERWQVTNLVQLERSPILWFYLRPAGARPRRGEAEVLDRFAEQRFVAANLDCEVLVRQADGSYRASGRNAPYPVRPPDGPARAVLDEFTARGPARLRDVLTDLGLPTDLPTLSELRVRLTTTAFPFLQRVPGVDGG